MIARCNPFVSRRWHELAVRLRGVEWPELRARWEALGRQAALVGPHGSGKSTLAAALAAEWEKEGFQVRRLRLSEEQRSFPPDILGSPAWDLGARDVVILDGAEQMPAPAWHLFRWRCRRAGGLLITMHHQGRLPLLHQCDTDEKLMLDLLEELLGEPPDPDLRMVALRLFARHRGNVREVWRGLYDWFAETSEE